ncbi:MAG: DUF4279 domain-containing protein [Desulfatibacillum sp.]|nr:DUF4279 domain-containing protein [Desulfatibacillum sp.]
MDKIMQSDQLRENPHLKVVNVWLLIAGHYIIPSKITDELGIQPSRCFARGDKYVVKKFGIENKRFSGHWSITTEGMLFSTSVEKHARRLLELLRKGNQEAIRSYIENPDCRVSVSFWIESKEHNPTNFDLSQGTMKELSEWCEDFSFRLL